jgi:hypothetical protein
MMRGIKVEEKIYLSMHEHKETAESIKQFKQ